MRLKTDYTLTAKIFHWLTALLVIYQLGSGMWMTSAIFDIKLRAIAWKTYQNHKSIGITILLITLLRGIWRISHPPPDHTNWLKQWERYAALTAHLSLYGILIFNPLLGWIMVSTSPLKLPTIIFSWFTWPHIPIPEYLHPYDVYITSKSLHQFTGYLLIIILFIHISAALKHHFIDKNAVLQSMLPKFTTTEKKS